MKTFNISQLDRDGDTIRNIVTNAHGRIQALQIARVWLNNARAHEMRSTYDRDNCIDDIMLDGKLIGMVTLLDED
jgi:hypothetical protein